jgi:hypothetical protein
MERIKIEKALERSYGPIVIWFDDLSEIVNMLKQAPGGVQIDMQGYRYDSLDELREKAGGRTQSALTIASQSEGDASAVSLELTPVSVTLSVFDPQGRSEAVKLFYDIDHIIAPCVRRFAPLYKIGNVGVVWCLLLLFLFQFPPTFEDKVNVALAVLFGVLLLWSIWATFVNVRWSSVIRLQRRVEARPFLERNKDQLLVLLFGAAIGVLTSFSGVALKEQFYPSATSCSTSKAP